MNLECVHRNNESQNRLIWFVVTTYSYKSGDFRISTFFYSDPKEKSGSAQTLKLSANSIRLLINSVTPVNLFISGIESDHQNVSVVIFHDLNINPKSGTIFSLSKNSSSQSILFSSNKEKLENGFVYFKSFSNSLNLKNGVDFIKPFVYISSKDDLFYPDIESLTIQEGKSRFFELTIFDSKFEKIQAESKDVEANVSLISSSDNINKYLVEVTSKYSPFYQGTKAGFIDFILFYEKTQRNYKFPVYILEKDVPQLQVSKTYLQMYIYEKTEIFIKPLFTYVDKYTVNILNECNATINPESFTIKDIDSNIKLSISSNTVEFCKISFFSLQIPNLLIPSVIVSVIPTYNNANIIPNTLSLIAYESETVNYSLSAIGDLVSPLSVHISSEEEVIIYQTNLFFYKSQEFATVSLNCKKSGEYSLLHRDNNNNTLFKISLKVLEANELSIRTSIDKVRLEPFETMTYSLALNKPPIEPVTLSITSSSDKIIISPNKLTLNDVNQHKISISNINSIGISYISHQGGIKCSDIIIISEYKKPNFHLSERTIKLKPLDKKYFSISLTNHINEDITLFLSGYGLSIDPNVLSFKYPHSQLVSVSFSNHSFSSTNLVITSNSSIILQPTNIVRFLYQHPGTSIINPPKSITIDQSQYYTSHISLLYPPQQKTIIKLSLNTQVFQYTEEIIFNESDWNVSKEYSIRIKNEKDFSGKITLNYNLDFQIDDITIATSQINVVSDDSDVKFIFPEHIIVQANKSFDFNVMLLNNRKESIIFLKYSDKCLEIDPNILFFTSDISEYSIKAFIKCENNLTITYEFNNSVSIFPRQLLSVIKAAVTCAPGSYYWNNGCTNCPKGHYCSGGMLTSCLPGKYNPNEGSSLVANCLDCPAGKFSTSYGSSACIECPSGYDCSNPANIIVCPSGKYGENGVCKDCTLPKYTDHEGMPECFSCPSDSICTSTSGTPTKCAEGSTPNGGQSSCTPCTDSICYNGKRNNCPSGSQFILNKCIPCPAGYSCTNPTSITQCLAGTYSSGGSVTGCTPCEDGYFQNQSGQSKCLPCPVGYSCSKTTSTKCTAGTYSPEYSAICIDCPNGYTNSPNFDTCSPCPAGQFCSRPGSSNVCEDGTYSGGGAEACQSCPLGMIPNAAKTDCVYCPAGSYCNSLKLKDSLPCPAGSYNLIGVNTYCQTCPAGYSCANPTILPTKCAASQYSEVNKTLCTLCPVTYDCTVLPPIKCSTGTYNPGNRLNCLQCPAGHQCSEGMDKGECPQGTYSNITSCIICPANHICPYPDTIPVPCPNNTIVSSDSKSCQSCPASSICENGVETKCPLGKYRPVDLTSCIDCPAGFYCPANISIPINCGLGKYSSKGSSTCTDCPAGSYCTSVSKFTCPKGTYSKIGSITCSPCPAGSACLNPATLPVPCLSGYYSTIQETECHECKAGYACPIPSYSPFKCPLGTYSIAKSTQCTSCPAHNACPKPNSTPLQCTAGNYAPIGSSSCFKCPAGFFCTGTAFPVACSLNKYSEIGSSTCTDCPAGYSCTPTGQKSKCLAGFYSLDKEMHCTICPAGSYCAVQDKAPVNCPINKYSMEGQTSCTDCLQGYDCSTSNILPNQCPALTYRINENTCRDCEDGFLCPSGPHSKTKVICPSGGYCIRGVFTYCPAFFKPISQGAKTEAEGCRRCENGEFCPFNALNPLPCPIGYYCTQGQRIQCPAGTYGDQLSLKLIGDCKRCPAGKYCAIGSTTPDVLCPIGFYCTEAVLTPVACPAGKYGYRAGLSEEDSCLDCLPGYYCPTRVGTTISPLYCLPTTFNDLVGQAACKNCPLGSECFFTGLTKEAFTCLPGTICNGNPSLKTTCPAGTYSLFGSSQCLQCPAGFYCIQGTGVVGTLPIICPPGNFCPLGSRIPTVCPAGTYSYFLSLKAASECFDCPAGFHCGAGSTTPTGNCATGHYCPIKTPTQTSNRCPVGTYTKMTNLTHIEQCTKCPTGNSCPNTGTTNPTPCTPGKYQDTVGQSSCKNCVAGYYCKTGSVLPTPCGTGFYSDSSASTCIKCNSGYYCPLNATSLNDKNTNYRCPAGLYCPTDIDTEIHINLDLCPSTNPTCKTGVSIVPHFGSHSCPTGNYCPEAAANPIKCPAGTYNPNPGRGAIGDCISTPAGYYTLIGSSKITGPCSPGYYCPIKSTNPTQISCPAGTYRSLENGKSIDDCAQCPPGFYCLDHTAIPSKCKAGKYCLQATSTEEATNCPRGTYGSTAGLRRPEDCTPCPAGKYCIGNGGVTPTGECSAGYICYENSYTVNPNDGIQGIRCPAGGYCPEGSSRSYPCPEGKFNTLEGQTDESNCKDCTPGYYCQGASSASETGKCSGGYYCTGGSATPYQVITPIGHYSPPGSSSPTKCDFGTYSSREGQEVCSKCPPGAYCSEIGMSTTHICTEGSYCPEGSINPTPCPAGTYSNKRALQKLDQCTQCDPGYYCSSPKSTAVTGLCDAGHLCYGGSSEKNPVAKPYGDICTRGYFCSSGSYLPSPCLPGTFGERTGLKQANECSACLAGKYCNKNLTEPDGDCAAGYYCAIGSSFPSPPDNFPSYGLCTEGNFCPPGTSVPKKCAKGFYSNRKGLSECYRCPAGFYCDGISTTTYKNCSAGNYCPEATTEEVKCPAGTYSDRTNLQSMEQCSKCTAGKVCTIPGLTAPDETCSKGFYCPEGSFTVQGANPTIHPCTAGHYCPLGTASPLPCLPGTYNKLTGKGDIIDCLDCEPGFYCPNSGMIASNIKCKGGHICYYKNTISSPVTFTDISGKLIGGELCPAGSYCPEGSSTPTTCPAGKYNQKTGESDCQICPGGYLCPQNTSILEQKYLCPVGHYCIAGSTTASKCPIGTYNPSTGIEKSEDCLPCDPGSYCATQGLSTVSGLCDEGYYCPGNVSVKNPPNYKCIDGQSCPAGSPKPIPCNPGSYCQSGATVTGKCNAGYYCIEGSTTATPTDGITGNICPPGAYCPSGSSSPILCPPGTYLGVQGSSDISNCKDCPGGFICLLSGSTSANTKCPAGSYCPIKAKFPIDCPAGSFCPEGSPGHTFCPEATYTIYLRSESCNPCPAGFDCTPGIATPQVCPPGYYCPEGITKKKCPRGKYSNLLSLYREDQCLDCPEGSYCETDGLAAVTGPCTAGFYCKNNTVKPTLVCTKGHVCPEGSAAPKSCLPGTYNPSTQSTSTNNCLPCELGKFCPYFGLESGIPCLENYYCNKLGISSLTGTNLCTPGHYCPTGTKEPIKCEVSKYNPNTGSSACLECEGGYYCPTESIIIPDICPAGSYCPPNTGLDNKCPINTYNQIEGRNKTFCIGCLESYQCEIGVSTPTTNCQPGFYCEECKSPDCISKAPQICPIGHYCAAKSAQPTPCPIGTYSTQTGLIDAASCKSCPEGKYCPLSNIMAPIDCPAGFYCPSRTGDLNDTFLCTMGHYCPQNTITPVICPEGNFTSYKGAYWCESCPIGFECLEGCSIPQECPKGKNCNTPISVKCPEGTYSPYPGNGEICYPCPDGFACPDEESKDYSIKCNAGYYCPFSSTNNNSILCPVGYYCPESSGAPFPCPSGTYSILTGLESKAECLKCPEGNFCPGTGLNISSVYDCLEGFYCSEGLDTLKLKDLCTIGHYCPASTITPEKCPIGKFNPDLGLEECNDCPAGYFCKNEETKNLSDTLLCDKGSYCTIGTTTIDNKKCPKGRFSDMVGLKSVDGCLDCLPGKACPNEGTTFNMLVNCSEGYYCAHGSNNIAPEIVGNINFGPCPSGHYCPIGSSSPLPCPTDTYSTTTKNTDISMCLGCPSKSYCPSNGNNNSLTLPCLPGFYCNSIDMPFTKCSSGHYCPIGSSSPIACTPNHYCLEGFEIPFPCPIGFYQPDSAKSSCLKCPTGFYCSKNNTLFQYNGLSYYPAQLPKPCPAGTYSNLPGLTDLNYCPSCPPGSFCPNANTAAPLLCDEGYYCDLGSATPRQKICPSGSYCPTGSSSPTMCKTGFYNEMEGQKDDTSCLKCPPGFYCPNFKMEIGGIDCPEGYYCPEGTSRIDKPSNFCPKGYYCPLNSDAPIKCPEGTYQDVILQNRCKDCIAGFECDEASEKMELCSKGFYCPIKSSSTTHKPCPIGTYNPYNGSERPQQCLPCPAGFICETLALVLPITKCPAGSYCPGGNSVGLNCPVGHYCLEGSQEPLPCPPGTYSNRQSLISAAQCSQCDEGYYCDQYGTSAPVKECIAGFYCQTGTKTPSDLCSINSYCEKKSASPKQCLEKTYNLIEGSTTCLDCTEGYFCNNGLNTCTAGGYCPPKVSAPLKCPKGTFNSLTGIINATECQKCPPGMYCDVDGLSDSSTSITCQEGYYCILGQSKKNPTDIINSGYIGSIIKATPLSGGALCPKGHYCPSGSSAPISCPLGTYNENTGSISAAACQKCKESNFCPYRGDKIGILACPAGFYCDLGVIYPQIPCPVNTYCPPNQKKPIETPNSAYQDATGQSTYNDCRSGYYCPIGLGEIICPVNYYCPQNISSYQSYPCPMGTYSAKIGLTDVTQCQLCQPGLYCDTKPTGTPKICPEGKYCPEGTVSPIICPKGFYCSDGSPNPTPCPVGTYGTTSGSISLGDCKPCEAAFMCPFTNSTSSTIPCLSGYYCQEGTTNATLQCPAGSYCPEKVDSPIPCTAGTYQDEKGGKICKECPERFYCDENTINPLPCPLGSYCPFGTTNTTIKLCPIGTFASTNSLAAADDCTPCTEGKYCASEGLLSPTDLCNEGYYCKLGSIEPEPLNKPYGSKCPANFYCPLGSTQPISCPSGTYSIDTGLISSDECLQCPNGKICYFNGVNITEECPPGYKCSGGDGYPKDLCPTGHYCKSGTTNPVKCEIGKYQSLKGSSDCLDCVDGYTCTNEGLSNPLPCPAGRFCNNSSINPINCPSGTFNSITGLKDDSLCIPCKPGYYCQTEGIVVPTTKCGKGHYCSIGAKTEKPNDEVQGGKCREGFICLEGAMSPNPISNSFTTSIICPENKYCPEGAEDYLPCLPTTYNPISNQGECFICPAGYMCVGDSPPSSCAAPKFCGDGTDSGELCPDGTFTIQGLLSSSEQCSYCKLGRYCQGGENKGDCAAGYICYANSSTPTPQYSLCPKNHYCKEGCKLPIKCPPGKISDKGSKEESDCRDCPDGYLCNDGDIDAVPCYKGFYCPPKATIAVACDFFTYNPDEGKSKADSCLPCPAGSFCNSTGIHTPEDFPCHAGYYCEERAEEMIACVNGTYRWKPYGKSETDCLPCPEGSYCTSPSVIPYLCPSKYFCPARSELPLPCPKGYYCPPQSSDKVICPSGNYCPELSEGPLACQQGTYCPEGAGEPSDCPLGTYSPSTSNSNVDSCIPCPPGTYSYNTTFCAVCEGGYVCLGGTTSSTPTDVERDKGYSCPKGSFCPPGSWVELPCPPGSYGNQLGYKNESQCIPCPDNFYNPKYGQEGCFICSKSAYAESGSKVCKCKGLHRIFQPTDGTCVCEPLYEFYLNFEVKTGDSDIDCQPIVFQRCPVGSIRNNLGECISVVEYCRGICPGNDGIYLPSIGFCDCKTTPFIDQICDEECQRNSQIISINPKTEKVEVKAASGEVLKEINWKDSIYTAGSVSCTRTSIYDDKNGCKLHSIISGTDGFYGSYDIPLFFREQMRMLSTANLIPKPLICVESGDGVVWDIQNSYPVYMKDNLMNTNPLFDQGEFSKLVYTLKEQQEIKVFSFIFNEEGTYVFAPNTDANNIMIVTVVPSGTKCSIPSITSQKTDQFVSIHIESLSNVHLEPDWASIITILVALFVFITIILGSIYQLRKNSWGDTITQINSKKVREEDIINKLRVFIKGYKTTVESLGERTLTADEIRQQIDMFSDDMDIKQLFLKFTDHENKLNKLTETSKNLIETAMNELKKYLTELQQLLGNLLLLSQSKSQKDKNYLETKFSGFCNHSLEFKTKFEVSVQNIKSTFSDLYDKFHNGLDDLANDLTTNLVNNGVNDFDDNVINVLLNNYKENVGDMNNILIDHRNNVKKYQPIIDMIQTTADPSSNEMKLINDYREYDYGIGQLEEYLKSITNNLTTLNINDIFSEDDQDLKSGNKTKIMEKIKKHLKPMYDLILSNYSVLNDKLMQLQNNNKDEIITRETIRRSSININVAEKMNSITEEEELDDGLKIKILDEIEYNDNEEMREFKYKNRKFMDKLKDLVNEEEEEEDEDYDEEIKRLIEEEKEEKKKLNEKTNTLIQDQYMQLELKLKQRKQRGKKPKGEIDKDNHINQLIEENYILEEKYLVKQIDGQNEEDINKEAIENMKKENPELVEDIEAIEAAMNKRLRIEELKYKEKINNLENNIKKELDLELEEMRKNMDKEFENKNKELEDEREKELKQAKNDEERKKIMEKYERKRERIKQDWLKELSEKETELQLKAKKRKLEIEIEEDVNYDEELERIKKEAFEENQELKEKLESSKDNQRKLLGDQLEERKRKRLERLMKKKNDELIEKDTEENDEVSEMLRELKQVIININHQDSSEDIKEKELRELEEQLAKEFKEKEKEMMKEDQKKIKEVEDRNRLLIEKKLKEEEEKMKEQLKNTSDEEELTKIKEEYENNIRELKTRMEGDVESQKEKLAEKLKKKREYRKKLLNIEKDQQLQNKENDINLILIKDKLEKEKEVIKKHLLKSNIKGSEVTKSIDLILQKRHIEEFENMLLQQLTEQALTLQKEMNSFYDERKSKKIELLKELKKQGVSLQKQDQSLLEFEREYKEKEIEIEAKVLDNLNEKHEKEKKLTAERHLKERLDLYKEFTTKEVLDKEIARLNEENNSSLLEIEKRRAEQQRKLEEEQMNKTDLIELEYLREKERLEKEQQELLDEERRKVEKIFEVQTALLVESQPDMEKIEDEEERKRILAEFEERKKELRNNLDNEQKEQSSKLKNKLEQRKQKRLKLKEDKLKLAKEHNLKMITDKLKFKPANRMIQINQQIVQPIEEVVIQEPEIVLTSEMLNPTAVIHKLYSIEQVISNIQSFNEEMSITQEETGVLYEDNMEQLLPIDFETIELQKSNLTARELKRYEFANDLLEMLEVSKDFVIKPATSVKNFNQVNNQFKRSFSFDNRTIYIRRERFGNAGDLMFLIIHIVSHIQVKDEFNDDTSPLFISKFIDNIKKCTEKLFSYQKQKVIIPQQIIEDFSWEKAQVNLNNYLEFLKNNP